MTFSVVAVAFAIAIFSGCTGSGPEPTGDPSSIAGPTSPTPTSTPTVDAAVVEAKTAGLAAYTAYWAAVVASFSDPTKTQDPALEQNAGHTALTDAQSVLIKYRADGIHMVGEPVFSPSAKDVVLGASPTVTIADCVDASNWTPVFTASGDSAAAPGQRPRVSYTTTVVKLEEHWLVWTVTVDRESPC